MPVNNQVALRTDMVPMLDEIYKLGSTSGVLDSDAGLVNLRAGKFQLPVMTMDGLANHSRTNGGVYQDGDVTLTWETYAPTYERNRMFTVDVMDNYETADIAFSRLAGEFIRTRVIPEIDAVRFAAYFGEATAGNKIEELIATPEELTTSIVKSISKLEENEVPQEDTFLFITPTAYNKILLLKTFESIKMLEWFGDRIHRVPQNRFQTEITLLDGKTTGQEKGGWTKGATSQNINYGIIHRGAIIQGLKHEAPKYIPSGVNQRADGDAFAYRVCGVELVKKQKLDGLVFSYEPDGE